jgi:hypothetical protein
MLVQMQMPTSTVNLMKMPNVMTWHTTMTLKLTKKQNLALTIFNTIAKSEQMQKLASVLMCNQQ